MCECADSDVSDITTPLDAAPAEKAAPAAPEAPKAETTPTPATPPPPSGDVSGPIPTTVPPIPPVPGETHGTTISYANSSRTDQPFVTVQPPPPPPQPSGGGYPTAGTRTEKRVCENSITHIVSGMGDTLLSIDYSSDRVNLVHRHISIDTSLLL